MAESPKFHYTPLSKGSDFRLVLLEKDSSSYILRCELLNASFLSNPSYEALSYEWGLPSPQDQPLYVNGRTLSVRKNLYNALLHLRNKSKKRCLWIDAICIDQEDVLDRSQQVSLMGQIYGNARDVLVWLGSPRDGSDLAIEYLRNLGRRQVVRGSIAKFGSAEKAHAPQMEAVAALCNFSYWQRIWIVQEIQLAKNLIIHCGDSSMSWEAFSRALYSLIDSDAVRHTEPVKQTVSSLAFQLVCYRKLHKRPLRYWLDTCQNSLCADPRDKVYAMLGIASDCRDLIVPDYTNTLSQLYREVIKAHSWDAIAVRDMITLSQFLQGTLWNGEPIALPPNDNAPILIPAFYCGLIVELDELPYEPAPGIILTPRNIVKKPLKQFASLESIIQVIGLDCGSSLSMTSLTQNLFDQEIRLLDPLPQTQKSTSLHESTELSKSAQWRPSVRDFVVGHESSRIIGSVSSEVRIGDSIYTFPGTQIALVVRKQPEEGLVLVGRAWLFEPYKPGEPEAIHLNSIIPQASPRTFTVGTLVSLKLDYAALQRLTTN